MHRRNLITRSVSFSLHFFYQRINPKSRFAFHYSTIKLFLGNYSSFKGELSAVLKMVKHFKYFLQWRKFKIRTDHQPLTRIHLFEPPSQFEARLLHSLSTFNFDIEYRPGKKHANADSLSRANHAEPSTETGESPEEDAENEFAQVTVIHPFQQRINKIKPLITPHHHETKGEDFTTSWWIKGQQEDPALRWACRWVVQNLHKKPSETLVPPRNEAILYGHYGQWLQSHFLSLALDQSGVLCYLNKPDGKTGSSDIAHPSTKQRIYSRLVPSKHQVQVVTRGHVASAHSGAHATTHYVKMGQVYFPGLRTMCVAICKSCYTCQSASGAPKPQKGIYQPTHNGN